MHSRGRQRERWVAGQDDVELAGGALERGECFFLLTLVEIFQSRLRLLDRTGGVRQESFALLFGLILGLGVGLARCLRICKNCGREQCQRPQDESQYGFA